MKPLTETTIVDQVLSNDNFTFCPITGHCLSSIAQKSTQQKAQQSMYQRTYTLKKQSLESKRNWTVKR